MKWSMAKAVTVLSVVLNLNAAFVDAQTSPVTKVVTFIASLKTEVEQAKVTEAQSFKKYQDWCNDTIVKATSEIAAAVQTIDTATATINKLSGVAGGDVVRIESAKKNIEELKTGMLEAQTIRQKENEGFMATAAELSASIVSLDGALKSLQAKSPSSFLTVGQVNRQKDPLSRVLLQTSIQSAMSPSDLELLQKFIQQGPAGSYNGATGEVLAIVKQTMANFQQDLDTASKDEQSKNDSHAKLMASMGSQIKQLSDQVIQETTSNGAAVKDLMDAKQLRQETEVEMQATQKLKDDTSLGCRKKAEDFAVRTRLREEELIGINQALAVLTSAEANKTLAEAAAVNFLQIDSTVAHYENRDRAFAALKKVAAKYKSTKLAQLAVRVLTGGRFDKIIKVLDKQVTSLRSEEQDDIKHRDQCNQEMTDTAASLEDLNHKVSTLATTLTRLSEKANQLKEELQAVNTDLNNTKGEMQTLGTVRTSDRNKFITNQKKDQEALALVTNALGLLQKFYQKNKVGGVIPTTKLAAEQATPSAAPEIFKDANYTGAKDASKVVLTMLEMVKTGIQDEIAADKASEAMAIEQFEKAIKELSNLKDSLLAKQMALNKDMADLQSKVAQTDSQKSSSQKEATATAATAAALKKDCAWVTTNFDSRRTKRQAEIDGLLEAKSLLAQSGGA